MHLEVEGPVIDGIHSPSEYLRKDVPVDQVGEGGSRIEVGHHDWCGDAVAIAESHAGHPTSVNGDLIDFDVASELASGRLELCEEMIGDGADTPFDVGHGHVAGG